MRICGATMSWPEFCPGRLRGFLCVLAAAVLALGLSGCTFRSGLMEPVAEEAPSDPGENAVVTFWRKFSNVQQAPVAEAVSGDELKIVGILSGNTKIRYETGPGRHVFVIGGESGSILEADLAPSMYYYVRIIRHWGWAKERYEMKAVPPGELEKSKVREEIGECTFVVPKAEAAAWLEENKASMKKKLETGREKFNEREDASRYVLPASYGVRERF